MIVSPLAIVCWFRGVYRSARAGHYFVDGCDYVEAEPVDGQPICVSVLHCSLCGKLSVGWGTCARCGHRPGPKIEIGEGSAER